MFTLPDTGRPARIVPAVRFCTRTILLVGLTAFLVSPAHAPAASFAEPALAVADDTAHPGSDDVLSRALAGMRYRLSATERDRYRRLFSAIERGDWRLADTALEQLQDRRLLGHVLAARALAPDFHPNFAELRSWLDLYGDLPEADAIRRLAETVRAPSGQAPAPRPRNASAPHDVVVDPDAIVSSEPHTAPGDRAVARYYAGDLKGALADSGKAAAALGDRASTSSWIAGLAAWRVGDLEQASRYFTAASQSRTASGWMQAAGAYWAGRVEERRHAKAAAAKWFDRASRYRTTFYGLLAMRKLGLDIGQELSAASLTAEHLNRLAETPAGYRAVALLEIGRRDLAARELERIDAGSDPRLEEALILVADAAHLGELSDNLAQRISVPAGPALISERFPIPRWQPRGGFRIDPALVYAVARQESRFDPHAVSPAGAAGLMQIMPHTAEALGTSSDKALFDPATNLDLGQRYLTNLMEDPNIGENLLLVTVAYNAGVTNLGKLRRMLEQSDPLVAIESIPSDETRGFIQRVLANYWVYRARMGRETDSLSDLARGEWPRYRRDAWDDADYDPARN